MQGVEDSKACEPTGLMLLTMKMLGEQKGNIRMGDHMPSSVRQHL